MKDYPQPHQYDTLLDSIDDRRETPAPLFSPDAYPYTESDKGAFLADMSHEIRTPLTSILGYTELLREIIEKHSLKNKDSRKHKSKAELQELELVQIIHRNGEYLLKLINNILDFSKIDAGKCQLNVSACSLEELILDIRALFQSQAQAKGLDFRIEIPGPLPGAISTDNVRLRQILINLLGNALKFTPQGKVVLRIRWEPKAKRKGKLLFDIIDSGIGLNAAQIAKIFDPFAQAEAATSDKFGGTGLGLPISRRIAHLLGGDIEVESTPDSGSLFRLYLGVQADPREMIFPSEIDPASRKKTSGQASPSNVSNRPNGKKDLTLSGHVLLAEDGQDNSRLIAHILRKAGLEVSLVDNGRTAVELVIGAFPGRSKRAGDLKMPVDLVLMDMQMPEMDGYEATRFLREKGYRGPILALTAHAMHGDREKCLEAGCNEYLTKPLRSRQLLEMVSHLLPSKKQS